MANNNANGRQGNQQMNEHVEFSVSVVQSAVLDEETLVLSVCVCVVRHAHGGDTPHAHRRRWVYCYLPPPYKHGPPFATTKTKIPRQRKMGRNPWGTYE